MKTALLFWFIGLGFPGHLVKHDRCVETACYSECASQCDVESLPECSLCDVASFEACRPGEVTYYDDI